MLNNPKFSIIICLYIPTERFYDDLKKCSSLKYKNFEIILVTEKNTIVPRFDLPVRVVKSKKEKISLGEKRDIGFEAANGEYCAFIDDDAYPHSEWLSNARKIFSKDPSVGAVGGPNMTPTEDGFWSQIGGLIYESYLTSGEAQPRFLPKKRRFAVELQGVNIIIRKDILQKLGGFKSRLYSGDDSKVCSNIRELGFKLVYDPNVIVYHHRRPFPFAHLKQIGNMGTHRGFFVKAYPQTLSPIYFLPTVLALGFFGGIILSFFLSTFRLVFFGIFLFFFLVGMTSVIKKAGIIKSFFVAIGIIFTHIIYGIFFIKGLSLKSIERKE